MKILRSIVETEQGQFLLDTEHDGAEISLLRIHPIIDGQVFPALPLCQFEGVDLLVEKTREVIQELE